MKYIIIIALKEFQIDNSTNKSGCFINLLLVDIIKDSYLNISISTKNDE